MVDHAWCKDVSRDERVRAAEDERQGPLPTLEECIERQKKSQTARPCGGTDPAPLGGEPSGAGNGMRTERVTLDITYKPLDWYPPKTWQWSALLLARCKSVRVVEDCCLDRINTGELLRQRDAAIRERDEAIAESERLRAERNAAINCVDEVNKSADAEVERLRTALADAIRRPMGVIPDSADGLVTQKELDEAEIRRPRNIPRTVLVEQLTDERDAAIREREQLRQSYRHCREVNASVCDERDALKARVEALESEVKLFNDGQPTAPSDLGLWDTAKGLSERCKELAARLVTTSVRATAAEARVAELEAAARAQSQQELQDCCDTEFVPAESAGSGAAERLHRETWLRLERDELIIQRDELISRVAELEAQANRLREDAAASARLMYSANSDCIDAQDERDSLQARVAELEAASGGGEGEPDAWGVVRGGNVDSVTHRRFRGDADRVAEQWGETVVPLYRSPPQPRGWLTDDEREAVQWAADAAYDKQHPAEDTLRNLLARSTPPEVVKPNEKHYHHITCSSRDADWLAALAAAGVEVKEVGK